MYHMLEIDGHPRLCPKDEGWPEIFFHSNLQLFRGNPPTPPLSLRSHAFLSRSSEEKFLSKWPFLESYYIAMISFLLI